MSFEQIILSFLQDVAEGIKVQQSSKGIRATGASAESLKAMMISGKATFTGVLVGNHYIFFQIFGRAPGRQPPPGAIDENWVFSKGITLVDISVESFLFLVNRKIGREGTDIFQGKRPGLSIDEEVGKNIDGLLKPLALEVQSVVVQTIQKGLKNRPPK